MFNQRYVTAVVVIVSLLSACEQSTGPTVEGDSTRIIGSGVPATKTFSLDSFQRVKARGVARVVIAPGPDEMVTVTADDNILPLLWARVEDGVLKVGMPDDDELDIRARTEVLFEVTYRQIDALDLQGVLVVDARGIQVDDLDVIVSGVSTLSIEGRADTQVVHVDGVSTYLASSLESRFVKITGNGVMDVVVNVSDELKGNVCGAGSVRYLGTPDVFVTACPGVRVSAG